MTKTRSAVVHFGHHKIHFCNSTPSQHFFFESLSLVDDMVSILLHQHTFHCPFDTANVHPGACRRLSQSHCHTKRSFKNYMTPDALHDPFLCLNRRSDRSAWLLSPGFRRIERRQMPQECFERRMVLATRMFNTDIPGQPHPQFLCGLVLPNGRNDESLRLDVAVIVL